MSTSQNSQGAKSQAMNQHLRSDPIPFIDVASQRRRLGDVAGRVAVRLAVAVVAVPVRVRVVDVVAAARAVAVGLAALAPDVELDVDRAGGCSRYRPMNRKRRC